MKYLRIDRNGDTQLNIKSMVSERGRWVNLRCAGYLYNEFWSLLAGRGRHRGDVRRARYEMRQIDPNSNIQLSLKIDKEPVLYEYRKITTEK